MSTYIPNNGYGVLSYGSATGPLSTQGVYVFPPTYSLSMSSKTVMADNGAAPKYVRNELTVKWYVPWDVIKNGAFVRSNPPTSPSGNASPRSIDTAIQQIRHILMEPRKPLTCYYQGLGPEHQQGSYKGFYIDASTDRNNGPLPLDFKASNIVAQKCIELTWVVAFHTYTPVTFNSINAITKPESIFNEVTWSRSFDFDENGNATITTNGKIELAKTSNTDLALSLIGANFPVPFYCRRISKKSNYDPTFRTITFSLVDQQHPYENALPPRCIKMDMSHEVSSSLFGKGLEGTGFHSWNNVIQGSITLPAGEPPITAYYLFWFYVRQRIDRVATGGVAGDVKTDGKDEKDLPKKEKVRNVVTKVTYKEDLFGRTHNFRIEYHGLYSKKKLIQQSGLFTPLYNYKQNSSNNHQPWYNLDDSLNEPWGANFDRSGTKIENFLSSQWAEYRNQFTGSPAYDLSKNSWSIYGNIGYGNATNAPIIFIPEDRSLDEPPIIPGVNSGNIIKGWLNSEALNTQGQDEQGAYSRTMMDDYSSNKDQTYLNYEFSVDFYENHNTYQFVRQNCDPNIYRALTSYRNEGVTDKDTTTFGFNNAFGVTGSNYLPSTSDYTSSYNGQSNMIAVLSGYAVRVAYPPTIPSLLAIQSQSVIRAETGYYSMKQIGSGEAPVYLAKWSIPYYVNQNVHDNVFAGLISNGLTGDLT